MMARRVFGGLLAHLVGWSARQRARRLVSSFTLLAPSFLLPLWGLGPLVGPDVINLRLMGEAAPFV